MRSVEPKSAVGWLRRAYDETNLRMPGSAPFEMTVTFHAYPGIDFAKKGKSPIVSGDGTYQETWISPHRWRREVTFGSYHAVEVEADGVRKFQASSDYEPSRVLMMLRALLDPVPRSVLEPELDRRRVHWKLKHLKVGTLPYIRIALGAGGIAVPAYYLLPGGILFRSEGASTGLVTSWEDDESFAGKLVPRRITVQGDGMKSPMVTAKVSITGVGSPAPAIQQLPGKPADANATMRPMDHFDRPAKFLNVKVPTEEGSGHHFPTKILISVIGQVDRQGRPREVEVSAIRNYGQPPSREDAREVWRMAEDTVKKVWADHFRPAIVDGKPCESLVHLNVWLGDCAGCGWGE